MKKLLLFAVMAVVSLTAGAQPKGSHNGVVRQGRHQVTGKAELTSSFQMGEFKQAQGVKNWSMGKKLSLDPNRLQPVERTKALRPSAMNDAMRLKTARKAPKMYGLEAATNLKGASLRKAPALKDSYTGKGTNYINRSDTTWAMTPTMAFVEKEGEVTDSFNVFVDVIPLTGYLKDALSNLYPDGYPVEYTIDDNGTITIEPQPIASYTNEAKDTTFYLTLFGANSDDEDGIINMQLAEDGLLKITNSNWIAIGEFANVPFDEDLDASKNFISIDELFCYVRYVYDGQKDGITEEQEYKGYGIDISTNSGVTWKMVRGTNTEDGVDTPVFVNLSPMDEMFASVFPEGIFVEYELEGSTATIKPQVIASTTDDEDKPIYLILSSGTSEDGTIVLTIADNGAITTIDNECILIAGWGTRNFDPTFDTYLGYYTYTDRVKYLLPDEPEPAPQSVSFAPNELVLFAGMGTTGYSFTNNLAVGAPFVATNFVNGTKDMATSFSWSAREVVSDTEENLLKADTRDFALTLTPDATYTDIALVAANGEAVSDSVYFGRRNMEMDDNGNPTSTPLYEASYLYAGGGESGFQFDDGSYAMWSRYNPDGDMAFYMNWATPDLTTTLQNPYSISKLYSYQGKPAAPLFLTGVKLPVVSGEFQENFNMHMTLYRCTRSSTGRIAELSDDDIIAEADATMENVTTEDIGGVKLSIVDFNELYVMNEYGLSDPLDYLFVEDEFMVVFSGIDNETFSGRFGSMSNDNEDLPVLWFEMSGEEGSMYSYNGWSPALMLGLSDATYGYLHTEDNTNLQFAAEGGEATIHVDPMYYNEETEEPTYNLAVEKIVIDGEEAEELPEWLTFAVANEDYTTATAIDEEGKEYEYFVNGIDYDLIVTAAALEDGKARTAEITFMQKGARLVVTVSQGAGSVAVRGDVNGDGTVDVADISAIISVMAGTAQYAAADVNGDGTVDVADISNVITIMAEN